MHSFKKIQYIDAAYLDFSFDFKMSDLKNIKLRVFTAFGIVRENEESDLIIDSFPKYNPNTNNNINLGYIIPKNALYTNYMKDKNKYINFNLEDKRIKILWKDIIILSGDKITKCPTMQTTGIVELEAEDLLIIKNPETIRISHLPEKKHPENVEVNKYIIPKCLIQSYDIL